MGRGAVYCARCGGDIEPESWGVKMTVPQNPVTQDPYREIEGRNVEPSNVTRERWTCPQCERTTLYPSQRERNRNLCARCYLYGAPKVEGRESERWC